MTDYNDDLKQTEDKLDEEMLKNEKLELEIKKLRSTIIAKKARINYWKNKYENLDKEATLENDKLKQKIKQMKPISKNTEKEWDLVFKATRKEISDLIEENKKLKKQIDE